VRIFVGKMLGAPVLNPKIIPSILETLHVHVFTSTLSKMREAKPDRRAWNSGKQLIKR
jgi:hypothetical protein